MPAGAGLHTRQDCQHQQQVEPAAGRFAGMPRWQVKVTAAAGLQEHVPAVPGAAAAVPGLPDMSTAWPSDPTHGPDQVLLSAPAGMAAATDMGWSSEVGLWQHEAAARQPCVPLPCGSEAGEQLPPIIAAGLVGDGAAAALREAPAALHQAAAVSAAAHAGEVATVAAAAGGTELPLQQWVSVQGAVEAEQQRTAAMHEQQAAASAANHAAPAQLRSPDATVKVARATGTAAAAAAGATAKQPAAQHKGTGKASATTKPEQQQQQGSKQHHKLNLRGTRSSGSSNVAKAAPKSPAQAPQQQPAKTARSTRRDVAAKQGRVTVPAARAAAAAAAAAKPGSGSSQPPRSSPQPMPKPSVFRRAHSSPSPPRRRADAEASASPVAAGLAAAVTSPGVGTVPTAVERNEAAAAASRVCGSLAGIANSLAALQQCVQQHSIAIAPAGAVHGGGPGPWLQPQLQQHPPCQPEQHLPGSASGLTVGAVEAVAAAALRVQGADGGNLGQVAARSRSSSPVKLAEGVQTQLAEYQHRLVQLKTKLHAASRPWTAHDSSAGGYTGGRGSSSTNIGLTWPPSAVVVRPQSPEAVSLVHPVSPVVVPAPLSHQQQLQGLQAVQGSPTGLLAAHAALAAAAAYPEWRVVGQPRKSSLAAPARADAGAAAGDIHSPGVFEATTRYAVISQALCRQVCFPITF